MTVCFANRSLRKSLNFGWVVSANTAHDDAFTADFNAFINCGRVRVCYLP